MRKEPPRRPLDRIDRALVAAVQQDVRRSNKELAARVGMDPLAFRRRLLAGSPRLLAVLDAAGVSGLELVSLDDVPPFDEAPETGATFEENAVAKARDGYAATRLPTLAVDRHVALFYPLVHAFYSHATYDKERERIQLGVTFYGDEQPPKD